MIELSIDVAEVREFIKDLKACGLITEHVELGGMDGWWVWRRSSRRSSSKPKSSGARSMWLKRDRNSRHCGVAQKNRQLYYQNNLGL